MPIMKLPSVITFSPAAIKQRFPQADLAHLQVVHHDKHKLVAHLAETHHLTMTEAMEEISDWLFVQELEDDAGAVMAAE
ncbi:hypothetical protein [Nereida sp. MMG025]|uniref:hypothetical protein n=1 Tax=Nereida sp. MMG025 TaxID=2909981 RepID=UPI001F2B98FF|nr:hypothetical protein [Nereida sp. MMG025]MCF6443288.1 hypothetical protein [Nereida sp. MMG025]